MKKARDRYLLDRYGITEDQYDKLLGEQGECCAVCKRHSDVFHKRLAVDHDHKTGEIRGLLCTHCNRYIVGRHRKGLGASLLLNAYQYLVKEYPGWVVPNKKKKRKKRKKKK